MAVQHGAPAPVGPPQAHPRSGHTGKIELLPAHVRHVGGEIAQKLLVPALLFKLLQGLRLRRPGAVKGLQHPHGGGQTAGLGEFSLLGESALQHFAGLIHGGASFKV
ncbi:hypothetical protein SDC9_140321 [bioreactor metagenome]|uniref:Uncharacterized protein n=1 Tax=bioreactor metagenome TaxID=1076179 RepID=A0A645DV72_9ZZZZ